MNYVYTTPRQRVHSTTALEHDDLPFKEPLQTSGRSGVIGTHAEEAAILSHDSHVPWSAVYSLCGMLELCQITASNSHAPKRWRRVEPAHTDTQTYGHSKKRHRVHRFTLISPWHTSILHVCANHLTRTYVAPFGMS